MLESSEILKSGAVDKMADLLHSLAGPLAEEIGAIFGDKLRVYRVKNLISTMRKTERILREAGLPPNAVPPRLLLPIIETSSVEENETLQEMWAGLLATASHESDSVSPSFVETLKQLTPYEARYLERIFDKEANFVGPRTNYLKHVFLNRIIRSNDMSPETFERLGLIRRDYKVMLSTASNEQGVVESVDSDIGHAFIFTEYAICFLDACRGPRAKVG
jgi:hypothetical protein